MTRTPRFRKKAHRSNGGPSALGDTPMRVASRCSYTPYRRLLRINDSPRTHVATGAAMVVATATMPMPGVTQSSPSPAVAYATPKNNNTATITFSTTPASPITRPMPNDRGSAYLRRTPPDVDRLQDRAQATGRARDEGHYRRAEQEHQPEQGDSIHYSTPSTTSQACHTP